MRRGLGKRAMSIPLAPRKVDEDVWKYPRPPLLQRTPKWVRLVVMADQSRLQVVWTASDGSEIVVADTERGYRVCETS